MHVFDKDLAIEKKSEFLYSSQVTDNWSINGIPNGGYLMSLLGNAMLQESRNDDMVVVTASYLSKLRPGPVDLAVEEFAASLNMDRFECRLLQDGKECIRAMGTFVRTRSSYEEDIREKDSPEIADLEECTPLPSLPKFTLFDNVDVRLDPDCSGWFMGKPGDRSMIKGWIRFKEDRAHDPQSILLMADAFPAPILVSQGMVAWVPTVELSVNMHKVPQTQWLKCQFTTNFMTRNFLQEDGEVWDENGELVAVSRQVAQFRKTI